MSNIGNVNKTSKSNPIKDMKLSPPMIRALKTLKEYGKAIRYKGGFWDKPNAKMVDSYKWSYEIVKDVSERVWVLDYSFPENEFGIGTLRALQKRHLVTQTGSHPKLKYETEFQITDEGLSCKI